MDQVKITPLNEILCWFHVYFVGEFVEDVLSRLFVFNFWDDSVEGYDLELLIKCVLVHSKQLADMHLFQEHIGVHDKGCFGVRVIHWIFFDDGGVVLVGGEHFGKLVRVLRSDDKGVVEHL